MTNKLLRVALSLLALGVVFLVVGVYHGLMTETVATTVAAGLQALASLCLIWVTMQYTKFTRESVELANQRTELKLRQEHTDTLRKRVIEWLGKSEGTQPNSDYKVEPDRPADLNIPQVNNTSIESAPHNQSIDLAGKKYQFRVAPESLENDRYFEDLINNHAQDLNGIKEKLEIGYGYFIGLKQDFVANYDDTDPIDELPIEASPSHDLEEWAFNCVILLERGERTKDGLKKRIREANTDSVFGDGTTNYYAGSQNNQKVVQSSSLINSSTRSTESKIVESLENLIDRLDDHPSYEIGQEAAEILDEMNFLCGELERTLVEYKGELVYSGDCEYLQEANITD